MTNMGKKYLVDNRKIFMYAYIYQVEEFFRKYNDKFFGAVLKNFFGISEISPRIYSKHQEAFFNKNVNEAQFFNENIYTIPFVRFSLNYTAIPNEYDGSLNHKYVRVIRLLEDDIRQATEKELELAYIKFIEYKTHFLNENAQSDDYFSKRLQPNNKDLVAYAYIKRIESLFGVNKYNIQIREDIYNRIFINGKPEIPEIEFERKVVFKTNKNGVKNKQYNSSEVVFYYCKINYNKILKMSLQELKEAHYKLDLVIKNIKENITKSYVDERRRTSSKFNIRPKERGLDIV